MKRLKSGNSGEVLGVAHLLCQLGDHGKFIRLFNRAFIQELMAFTEDGCAKIIEADAIPSLVVGLACKNEQAQTACGNALYRLAMHGQFLLLTAILDVLNSLVNRQMPPSNSGETCSVFSNRFAQE